ncbi:competence protein CoiA family protein [Azospirillum argentinense]|uniref:Competence protein CoiA family protein n=1 Tax=Azospirillum argentinense TaxID=2970906 RepID=A0ABW8VHB5_9PROT
MFSMPLLAIASDGARLEAWMMSSAEWEALKASYRTRGLTADCCGSAVVPVTSQTGWQFFCHKGADCPVRESPYHMIAKTVVARAAAALGLDVTTEARLNDGAAIADVLIRHPSWAVAVEVQLSRIPLIAIEDRQERYQTIGVRCAWLVGYDVPGHHPRQDLPLFRLVRPKTTDAVPHVIVTDADGHSGRTGLAGFTTMLLTGRINFQGPAMPASAPAVVSITSECWRCRRDIDLFTALINVPEHTIFAPRGVLSARDLTKIPQLMALYRSAIPKLLKAVPSLTTVRTPPPGKEAGGARAHCPWCDAPISLVKLPDDVFDSHRWGRCWTLSGDPWIPGPTAAR